MPSIPPVNYLDTVYGPSSDGTGDAECSYGGLTSRSPTNVYNYPGTATIRWYSRPETWNGSNWVLLTPSETFQATGYYNQLLANGWIFFYGTRGWQNLGITSTFATAPPSWNVPHGAYYATQDVTNWLTSAGAVLDSYVNYTNYCAA